MKKNQIKISDIFLISAQNIDCGYSLEPPRRGGSNEYAQSMFLSRNKKNNIYPCKPQFYYIKVRFKGSNYIGMFSWWLLQKKRFGAVSRTPTVTCGVVGVLVWVGALKPVLLARNLTLMFVCLRWGFTAQSTQWGHVERGQFT